MPTPAKKGNPCPSKPPSKAGGSKSGGSKSGGAKSGGAKAGGSKDANKNKLPPMRNVHINKSMGNVYVAVGLSALSGILFHFLHNRPRKQAYLNFYENYDAEASFNRMKEAGRFNSCPPEPPPPPPKK